MNDDERTVEIERLLKERSEPTARKSALLEETNEWAARIHEIRAAFGNPFFYSHHENADESVTNYTGTSSHEVSCPRCSPFRTWTGN
jgi:hypothetical protein